MVDSIFRTRSLGVAAEGLPDQYADGKAAKVWEFYIGSKQTRTSTYKQWFVELLKSRGCQNVLDVACGTGVDSIMLIENGFNLLSTDASDKMLKYALKERWARRKDENFDKWVIEEANWLTLEEDLEEFSEHCPPGGFDAVLCLGNSFAHLPDFEGNLSKQRLALSNFMSKVKPGGVLVVDHRNYDEILRTGQVPAKNVYYNSDYIVDMKCSNLYVNSKPSMVTLDYVMNMSNIAKENGSKLNLDGQEVHHKFRLSYYPHQLQEFRELIKNMFGEKYKHSVYGDFKPLAEVDTPAYYIHVIEKPQV